MCLPNVEFSILWIFHSAEGVVKTKQVSDLVDFSKKQVDEAESVNSGYDENKFRTCKVNITSFHSLS